MKGLNRSKLFTTVFLSILTFFLLCVPAYAEGGVAVTGSFSTYEYKIVQGETIDTPAINVIFVNNHNYEVKLRLHQDTPDGINIRINEEVVTVKANSRIEIPVVMTASEDALPGEYDIYVKATIIEDVIEGRVNIGSEYALKTKLTVFGEAADLDIDVVDVAGEPIKAVMNLYQLDNGSRSPLAYSDKGTIIERVIPGDYEVIAFWNDFQLVRHPFSVVSEQQYKKTLVAEIVQIYAYTVTPVFVENTDDQLATANIRFILHNIYKDLNNARVVLLVYKDDKLVEERDVFLYDTLEVNRHELGLHYVPAQGWDHAEYRFMLEFYVDEHNDNGDIINSTLYASSVPAILDVSSGFSFKDITSPQIFIIALVIIVLIGLFFLIRSLMQKGSKSAPVPPSTTTPKVAPSNVCPDCKGTHVMQCPHCSGSGKTLYASIEEECLYCSAAGEVICATCVNPKHLTPCPKCSGNGKINNIKCTYCNGIGHIIPKQYAKYKDGIKLKLGKK